MGRRSVGRENDTFTEPVETNPLPSMLWSQRQVSVLHQCFRMSSSIASAMRAASSVQVLPRFPVQGRSGEYAMQRIGESPHKSPPYQPPAYDTELAQDIDPLYAVGHCADGVQYGSSAHHARTLSLSVEVDIAAFVANTIDTMFRLAAVVPHDDKVFVPSRLDVLRRILDPHRQFVRSFSQEPNIRHLYKCPPELLPIAFTLRANKWQFLDAYHPLIHIQRKPDLLPTTLPEVPIWSTQRTMHLQLFRLHSLH